MKKIKHKIKNKDTEHKPEDASVERIMYSFEHPRQVKAFEEFIQHNPLSCLIPADMPIEWLNVLIAEMLFAQDNRDSMAVMICMAVLSIMGKKPVMINEFADIVSKKPLDIQENILHYSSCLMAYFIKRTGKKEMNDMLEEPQIKMLLESPPSLDDFFDPDRFRSLDVTKNFKEYLDMFHFDTPVRVAYFHIKSTVLHLGEYILIKGEKKHIDADIFEHLGLAKLCEKEPMLCTFRIKDNKYEKEGEHFNTIILPLQIAWTHEMLARYAPDLYVHEVQRAKTAYEEMLKQMPINHKTEDMMKLWGYATVLLNYPYMGNKENIIPYFSTPEAIGAWGPYLEGMREFSKKEPSIIYYIELANRLNTPYQVKVLKDSDGSNYLEFPERTAH